MNLISLVFVYLAFLAAPPSGLTDYQKLHRALTTKTLRAGATVEKVLDLCIPTTRRKLGPFTEYKFECLPGYNGLWLVTKDGRLRSAIEYDCTHGGTFFDDLTPAEARQYEALRKRNEHVPPDRCIGRLGWERPPRRLWDPDFGVPASRP
jgi:hypothetical protein